MFTGIVEEIGTVISILRENVSAKLNISCRTILEDINIGDSIAVNGICLTVTTYDKNGFSCDVMHETVNRSSISQLTPGSPVNLERAMRADGRFGGHIVSGHIDGTGKIIGVKNDGNAVWYKISCSDSIRKYIIQKGSVAIDGISLTIAAVDDSSFSVSVIPHTIEKTILKGKKPGDIVNLENDCVGKYIEHFLNIGKESNSSCKTSNITEEFLIKNGF